MNAVLEQLELAAPAEKNSRLTESSADLITGDIRSRCAKLLTKCPMGTILVPIAESGTSGIECTPQGGSFSSEAINTPHFLVALGPPPEDLLGDEFLACYPLQTKAVIFLNPKGEILSCIEIT